MSIDWQKEFDDCVAAHQDQPNPKAYAAIIITAQWLEQARIRVANGLKYSPDQPRVPAGSPEGGQFGEGGGGGGGGSGSGGGGGSGGASSVSDTSGQTSLSSESTSALLSYTEMSSVTNRNLRAGGKPSASDQALDRAIQANRLASDTTLYRGIDATTAAGLKEGKVFKDKGFVSTSSDPRMTSQGTRIIIQAPSGTNAQDVVHQLGAHPSFDKYRASEKEVLLGRGSRFKVTKVTAEGIYVKVVR